MPEQKEKKFVGEDGKLATQMGMQKGIKEATVCVVESGFNIIKFACNLLLEDGKAVEFVYERIFNFLYVIYFEEGQNNQVVIEALSGVLGYRPLCRYVDDNCASNLIIYNWVKDEQGYPEARINALKEASHIKELEELI